MTTITLTDQIAYNDATGDETILNGDFRIIEFDRLERVSGRYSTDTVLTWTVENESGTFGFSRVLGDAGKTVDFGGATVADLTNV